VLANQGDLHGRLGALLVAAGRPVDLEALTDTVGGGESYANAWECARQTLVPAGSRRSSRAGNQTKVFHPSYGKTESCGTWESSRRLVGPNSLAVGAKQPASMRTAVIVGTSIADSLFARSSWKMALMRDLGRVSRPEHGRAGDQRRGQILGRSALRSTTGTTGARRSSG